MSPVTSSARFWLALAALGVAAVAHPESHARPGKDDRVIERTHRVAVTFQDGNARFAVRRSFVNRSASHQPLSLPIGLPGAGVIDKLRVKTGRAWIDGVILEAEKAQEAYADLIVSGAPPRRQSPPVLLSLTGRETALLELPLLGPRQSLTIEYEILAPSCYGDGRLVVGYPRAADHWRFRSLAPTISGSALRAESELEFGELPAEAEGLSQQACHWSHSGDDMIMISTPASRRAEARWGTSWIKTPDGLVELGRYELELPDQLIAPPRRASLVFVLDASHSLGDHQLADQLKLAEAMATQLPDASIQIIATRRKATAFFQSFISMKRLESALRQVAPATLDLGNGSNLDAGLELAAELASARRGPVRIVAFTDARLRRAFRNDAVISTLGRLPDQAVLHIVDLTRGDGAIEESTHRGHRLESIAHATRGTVIAISGETRSDADNQDVMKHLIAPTRLDDVRLDANAMIELRRESVPLGSGFRAFGIATSAPHQVRLHGWLWGRRWLLAANREQRFSQVVSKLAIGDPHSGLDDASRERLALATSTLSELTSFLATSGKRVVVGMGFGISGSSRGST